MLSVRPKTVTWLIRLILLAGLSGLAAITLPDRAASLMYAWPGSLFRDAALLVPLLVLVLRATISGPLRLPAAPWLALVAAATIALMASALASPYRGSSLGWTGAPLAGLASFLLLHDWLQADPANRTRLAGIAAIVAAGLMATSALYWLGDVSRLTRAEFYSAQIFDMRNGHPLGHTSYTAGLAILCVPWLARAAAQGHGRQRAGAGAALLLALLILFTSGSRGGLLGLAALGITAAVGHRLGWRKIVLLAGAALLLTGGLILANPRLRTLVGPANPAAELSTSNTQRRAMLQAGLLMGADRPLLGWGLGTTPLVYPRFRARLDGGAEDVLQLHSTPVELWAGLGSAGVILLGAFAGLAVSGWRRAPTAATGLLGYGVFALTDYQLDVPVFALAGAFLAAQVSTPSAFAASRVARRIIAAGILAVLGLVAALGRGDPAPELNTEALARARDPAQVPRAIALLRESLALNPDQEIAHFNLGWLLLVRDPAAAERHFLTAARLVPDKGGVYFGLGLARLNQGRNAEAARALALECLNEPRFLASPWWREPALAAVREPAQAACEEMLAAVRATLPAGSWAARQAAQVGTLVPRLGQVVPGPEVSFRRERTGYPVLMRNLNLAPPVDLYDVREDPTFAGSLGFALPPKGWLPAPLVLKLLDGRPTDRHK